MTYFKRGEKEKNKLLKKLGTRNNLLDLIENGTIFLPINGPGLENGCHWSLIVYSSKKGLFYHIDSSVSQINNRYAESLCTILATLLPFKRKLLHIKTRYTQQGSWECGYFVILTVIN